ncbi:hypothetical protein MMC30_000504 [Trapelia coarctata]|nr:hypothetical protein [Trapelia coarctata]
MEARRKPFPHPPLPATRALRLIKDLEFHADDSRLSCTLESFDLDTCPPYAALSYTWGPPMVGTSEEDGYNDPHHCELKTKSVNGSAVLRIGKNLFEGLSQICQSELMGSIYGVAQEVIVWLGKDMMDFSDFASFHTDAITSTYLDDDESHDILARVHLAAPIFKPTSDEVSMEKWASYRKFYERRRWFIRAWVVQEVVLAREIEVLCGNGRLPWQSMVALATGVRSSSIAMQADNLRSSRQDRGIGDEVTRLGLLRELCGGDGPYQACTNEDEPGLKEYLAETYGATSPCAIRFAFLRHVISIIRPLGASNPRDKIYTAIGIVDKFDLEKSNPMVVPRYDVSTEMVYERVTRLLLAKLPWLSVLSMVEDKSCRVIAHLPSWVPDFSTLLADTSFKLSNLSDSRPQNASHGSPFGSSWSVRDSVLSLMGGCHDTVAYVGLPLSRPLSKMYSLIEAQTLMILESFEDALRLCLILQPTYVNGQGRMQALWRTLIADNGSRPVEFGQSFVGAVLAAMSLSAEFSMLQTIVDRIMHHLVGFQKSETIGGDTLVTPAQAEASCK